MGAGRFVVVAAVVLGEGAAVEAARLMLVRQYVEAHRDRDMDSSGRRSSLWHCRGGSRAVWYGVVVRCRRARSHDEPCHHHHGDGWRHPHREVRHVGYRTTENSSAATASGVLDQRATSRSTVLRACPESTVKRGGFALTSSFKQIAVKSPNMHPLR